MYLNRFQGQSTGLRFGTFVFGPVIMRFFYLANKPNEALALLKNPKCTPMFDQFISYQIILDLLLERKMYAEVSEVFDILQDRNIHGTKFPKNCTILVLAALYRMVCVPTLYFVFLNIATLIFNIWSSM